MGKKKDSLYKVNVGVYHKSNTGAIRKRVEDIQNVTGLSCRIDNNKTLQNYYSIYIDKLFDKDVALCIVTLLKMSRYLSYMEEVR